LKHIDLYSGIGGFALACRWAGIETIGFCEIDEFCQKVLKKNFPGVPIVEDINDVEKIKQIVTDSNNKRKPQPERIVEELRERTIDRTDSFILTAGFPCQPFSNAGRKQGASDNRYLWPQTLAVIESIKPDWIILENVAGLLNMVFPGDGTPVASQTALFRNENDEIADYESISGRINSDLRQAGYETVWLVIPACAVSAPHRRDRVWIVSHAISSGLPGEPRRRTGQEFTVGIDGNRPSQSEESELAQFEYSGQDCHAPNAQREGLEGTNTKRGTFGRRSAECRDIPGWKENWYKIATEFCRVDARVPDRVERLKALGNAIVPQVAYQIINSITGVEHGHK